MISEDLTLIAVALLIRNMDLDWRVGIIGAFLGIFLGDLALWALGKYAGRRVLALSWVARRLPQQRIDAAAEWFDRQGLWAMIAARFLPGTRLPLYFASGVLGKNTVKVVWWTFLAALIWTPLFVGAVAFVGEPLLKPVRKYLGGQWITLILLALALYVILRMVLKLFSLRGRRNFRVLANSIYRWEFWPTWLFYLPIVPYLGWLSLRNGGFSTVTAANPGIPMGGVIDESKAEILSRLPAQWILDFFLIPPNPLDERIAIFESKQAAHEWDFPLIFKPDNGYRGASVKLIRNMDGAREYLHRYAGAVVVQVFHPGPYEAGIFYYRLPHEARGRIFSITDKHFPLLIGDGTSTIEELIWAHPRFFMQAHTFLKRHAEMSARVLADGEKFPLTLAGNHCQGTLFADGSHLVTTELTDRIDAIAHHFQGFYFGRFDVRYATVEGFKSGTDLAIVELNGVTSESTNLYDPTWSILRAYATLAATWRIAFRIGKANRNTGTATTSLKDIWLALRNHNRSDLPDPLSD